ncbi:efflux RND transporter periplasmic adaptor subunit [Rhizobium herbae]|uniref:RND family efflux transporter MFP subunit n=1 Tax=Rhizobium herbae TaxID=508661 RepID=A0ABS4ERB0_9HYPH|nr:efflux RND transporter periplasmic adaptor subunit [Rhizobium herbae]MBP1860490.1 RND family efflux transporter MFP subunit [Rhizobium herbae]
MKKFWPTVCVVAVVGVGVGALGGDRIPYLSQFTKQPALQAENGDGKHAGGGQVQAGDQAGGGRHRRGNGGPTLVKTVSATKTTLPMDVTASGWAEADDTTAIAAQEQGVVTAVDVMDGAVVKQGDLIAELDDRTAQAAVDRDNATIVRDNAAFTEAEAALKRANDLLIQTAGTQQAYEQAKAARDTAAATLDVDKANLAADQVVLENTQIRAPFDGRLGDVGVSRGAFVSAGTAIVTIAKYDPIYVKFHLEERNLRRLKLALAAGPVDVTTVPQSDKGKARQGQISFYDNTIDTASGTILAKAKFENASGALWPGQSVNLVVHFKDPEQQIVVPTVAVNPGADGFYSYVVKDGKVELTPVTVARAEGSFTALAKGLSDGDHVVVEGQAQLTDQQHVDEQFSGQTENLASADQPELRTETLLTGAQP